MDKQTIGRTIRPKGRKYCNTPGTSCYYGPGDICVNCHRKKGWRKSHMATIPYEVEFKFRSRLQEIVEEYIREVEEQEDEDVIRATTVDKRLDDFALYILGS